MKFNFWKWVKYLSRVKVQKAYLKTNGCDSACPRCHVWESDGNRITTESVDGGCEQRVCGNCGYDWLAIFTPVGFVPIEGYVVKEKCDE